MKRQSTPEELMAAISRAKRYPDMKKYPHHGRVSIYDHSIRVTEKSLKIWARLHPHRDREELIIGAMLHDYFLYDWHHWEGPLHGFYHPELAEENALLDFDLTEKERNIIRSHMWPLTLLHLPKSHEAWVVCLADKLCALQETTAGILHKD